MKELKEVNCTNCQSTLSDKEISFYGDTCHTCMTDKMNAEIEEEERKRDAANNKVLETVFSMISESDIQHIKDIMSETSNFEYALVDAASGEIYDPDEEPLSTGYAYVDQNAGGGITGDEFSGHMYIPVGDGKFFKYNYVC